MCVFVPRQASLNEAAERYYGKALFFAILLDVMMLPSRLNHFYMHYLINFSFYDLLFKIKGPFYIYITFILNILF